MLKEFLDNKPLFYDEIDYLRMPKIYEKIKDKIILPRIVHIIGTNGKGTTGRFLATALYNLGFKTGHYTSPHILEFNERIWLNGKNVDNKRLNCAHAELQKILTIEDSKALSYFEYTTLLAMFIYQECDFVILEAGLGGEYDATAVFKKKLTLVTPIDIDHEAFLGDSVKEIAFTKLNAIQKDAIVATQKYQIVQEVAKEIALKKDAKIYRVDDFLDKQDRDKIIQISKNLSLVDYLVENLSLSISALNFLNIEYQVDSFKNARLFGRLSAVGKNVLVDVGHNPLAATSIVNALDGEKYILIYNSYRDKNYKKILKILKPIIKRVEIIEVNDKRIEVTQQLQSVLTELRIEYNSFKKINLKDKYLVFGSFSVVEAFLKGISR